MPKLQLPSSDSSSLADAQQRPNGPKRQILSRLLRASLLCACRSLGSHVTEGKCKIASMPVVCQRNSTACVSTIPCSVRGRETSLEKFVHRSFLHRGWDRAPHCSPLSLPNFFLRFQVQVICFAIRTESSSRIIRERPVKTAFRCRRHCRRLKDHLARDLGRHSNFTRPGFTCRLIRPSRPRITSIDATVWACIKLINPSADFKSPVHSICAALTARPSNNERCCLTNR